MLKTEKIDATLLSLKEPYNWDFKGKQGISYSGIFLVGDKTIVAKLPEAVYNEVKDLKVQVGKAIFSINVEVNGSLSPRPTCESFDWA